MLSVTKVIDTVPPLLSVPRSPVLPNPADNLADATSCIALGALWEEEDVLQPPRRGRTAPRVDAADRGRGNHRGGRRLRVGYPSSATVGLTTSWQYFHRTS
jgi:hypothetical protein